MLLRMDCLLFVICSAYRAINGVVAGNATRTTAEEIEAHLETLMPEL